MNHRGNFAAVIALFILAHFALAHPVPSLAHLRTVDVRLRTQEFCVYYRLDVDQLTVLREMVEAGKDKGLSKPTEFYEAYLQWQGPLIADQLFVSLDDKPLTIRVVEQKYEVLDHLRCEFIFVADWTLVGEQQVELRDESFPKEPGRVKLSLSEEGGVVAVRRTVPSGSLQARLPIDLRPGDDAKLRSIRATIRLENQSSNPVLSGQSPSSSQLSPHSGLVSLLEAPHGMIMLLVLAAIFGAAHALTPGHGKTMVAAYLIGERGTARHAIVLGLVTTITHTGAVLLLAAGLYWKYRDAAPATISAVLGFVGGLLIAGLGLWLLLRRLSGNADHIHLRGAGHTHNADGTVTYHDPPPTGWLRLVVLGVSGGIVPCWDAVLLLMFAISAQMIWLALPLLLAFSAGLAAVLVAIGLAVVYAKGVAGARWSDSRVWKALPMLSAAALIVLGILLCRDSLMLSTPG